MAITAGVCHRGQTHSTTALIFLPVKETVLRSTHTKSQHIIIQMSVKKYFFVFLTNEVQKNGKKRRA